MQQIQDLFTNLKPIKKTKSKRSLNFIGSAWKWIAGNPDHHDFTTIKQKMNNMLSNNNNQVVINRLYNERINNITRITNEIQKLLKDDNKLNNELLLKVQYRLKLMKEELRDVNYAIQWAKVGVINPILLSKSEIKIATEILDKNYLQYSTPEEALEFSETKIITNDESILYIINIPITSNITYDKLLLKPVKFENVISEIPYTKILKHNEEIFAIVKDCKTYNYLSICNHNNIIDISNCTCISNLLKSLHATCKEISNQNVASIDEISPGLILLNQFTGILNMKNETYNLNGTFLVKFDNTTITINNRSFTSKEISTFQALPAILQPTPREKKYRQLLSLELMKELHINNTNEIQLLESENSLHQITTYTLLTCIGIFLIASKIRSRRANTKIIIQKAEEKPCKTINPDIEIQKNLSSSAPAIIPPILDTTNYQETSRTKFYEVPFF